MIEELVLGKQIRTHVHNLRSFIFNPNRVNPIEVAQQNEQEFLVSDHHGRSSMEFLVRIVVIIMSIYLLSLGKLVTEKSVDFVGFENVVEFNKK
jgi:hypothetical protein